MVRAPCCQTSGLKKGPWTPEEDQKLIDYIQQNGYGNWRTLPKNAGLQRCGKSCRLRWTNYLRPDIKRGPFSFEEEETIIRLHSIIGNKWSAIAARLPGRTDNEIKNYWNTHIRKRLLRMGIDPVTHSPRLDLLDISTFLATSNLYHNNQSSTSVDPELLQIATSLMSQSQHNSQFGNYYGCQTQFDPTRLIQAHCFNDQLQHDHHHQSLVQIHAPQQQMPDYVPIMDSNNFTHDPFAGLYHGPESGQSQSIVDWVNGAEQSSSAIFPRHNLMQNSVISTPSSSSPVQYDNSNSNVYINSSCNSTEDERENYSNNNNGGDYSSRLMRMMKFEIPEGFDVNEFIY